MRSWILVFCFLLCTANGIVLGSDDLSVSFHRLGIELPISLSKHDLTICLPLPVLSGCQPSGGTLRFQNVKSPFTVKIFLGKELLFSGSPGSQGEVDFRFTSKDEAGAMLHVVIESFEGEEILAWLDPASEIYYSPNTEWPLYKIFGRTSEKSLSISSIESKIEDKEAVLKAASQIGAFYLPWGMEAILNTDESSESSIVIGSFNPPFKEEGGTLYVDRNHILELGNFLSGESQSFNSKITFKDRGYQEREKGNAWKVIFPITFSEAGFKSSRLDIHLQLSNASDKEVKLLISLGGVAKKKLILPPLSKDQKYFISLTTEGLKNDTQVTISTNNHGNDVLLSPESYFEVIPGDPISVIKLNEVARVLFGKGEVILSDLKEDHVQTAFKLIEFLAREQRHFLDFDLKEAFKVRGKRKGAWTLGLLASLDLSYYNPRVDVSWPFMTKSGFINSVLFPTGEYWSHSFIQVFNPDKPMVAFTDLSGDYEPWLKEGGWNEVFDYAAPFALKEKQEWIAIDYNIRFPPIYLDRFKLELWWQTYKGWVIGFLAVLTAIFLRFVWKTLTYKHEL